MSSIDNPLASKPFFKLTTKITYILQSFKIHAIGTTPPWHWAVIGGLSLLIASFVLRGTHPTHQPHEQDQVVYSGSVSGMLALLGITLFILACWGASHVRKLDCVTRTYGWAATAFANSVLLLISSLLQFVLYHNYRATLIVEICVTISLFALLQIIRPSTDFGFFSMVARVPLNVAWTYYGLDAVAWWTFFGILGLTCLKHWLDEDINMEEEEEEVGAQEKKKNDNKNGEVTKEKDNQSGQFIDVESLCKLSGPVLRNLEAGLSSKYPLLWALFGYAANVLCFNFVAKTNFGICKSWVRITGFIVGLVGFLVLTLTAKYVREWKIIKCPHKWWIQVITSTLVLVFISVVSYYNEDTMVSFWGELFFTLLLFSIIHMLKPRNDLNIVSYFSRLPMDTAWKLFGFQQRGVCIFMGIVCFTWIHYWLLQPVEEDDESIGH